MIIMIKSDDIFKINSRLVEHSFTEISFKENNPPNQTF